MTPRIQTRGIVARWMSFGTVVLALGGMGAAMAGCAPPVVVHSPPTAGSLDKHIALRVTARADPADTRDPASFAELLNGPLRSALRDEGFDLSAAPSATRLVVQVRDAGRKPGLNRSFCDLSVRSHSADSSKADLRLGARFGYREQMRFASSASEMKAARHCARELARHLARLRQGGG